jgi:two-component system, chemotaxis family, protein-glutamate methylesterase/glutaminase
MWGYTGMSRKRVLIVDDSAVVRQVLTAIVSSDPGFEVMAVAADPIFALKHMEREWPDIIITDVEMPRMDGVSFLRRIMAIRPTPVVVCSSLTEQGARTTLQAMEAGAIEVVAKPKLAGKQGMLECTQLILDALHCAAHVRLASVFMKPVPTVSREIQPKLSADVMLERGCDGAMIETTQGVVAIGVSTGGPQALQQLLSSLPLGVEGIVIVQHMPEKFTAAFAERLNNLCQIEVREAKDGDRVLSGCALIAPGGRHMLLKRDGAQYRVEVRDGPLVNRHRPSVNVLFRSVARFAGRNAMGLIMTGMGDDGAQGLLEMKRSGAKTLAQNEATCAVYGMPKEAVRLAAVDNVLPLHELGRQIATFRGRGNQVQRENQ